MRVRLLLMTCLAAAIAGCGGSASTDATAACHGLPTAKRTTSFLVLLGALNRLTKRDLCSRFGRPTSITSGAGHTLLWRYGAVQLILKGEHVIGSRTGSQTVPSGGEHPHPPRT